jgi:EAL domain-containing protein (putative c-di-GMP-specific phosphodiesterase class I)
MSLDFLTSTTGSWHHPPLRLPLLLFVSFAALVVHACQRLVERTAITIEPGERRTAFARTALCVGSLVWTLDVVGLHLFQDLQAGSARLAPVCASLLLMVLAARATIPALSNTQSSLRILLAAVGLALGMLGAHLLLMTALGSWSGRLRWDFLAASLLLAAFIAGWIAVRHRSAQLRAIKSDFRTISWPVKLLAGLLILPLHIFLVNTFPIEVDPARSPGNGLSVLIVLVLFGTAFSVDQMFKLRAEEKRQHLTNRALAMIRRVNPELGESSGYLLALIAERLPSLLTPETLQLHFQPICPTRPWTGGIRLEALLRVQDPDLGRIHPELFFLACERCGKSAWVDRALLELALTCSVPWAGASRNCAGISVNVAPDTLLVPGFVPWLEGLLHRRNWPAGWLQLEITEHALIAKAPQLAQTLLQLRAAGVQVAMDDFGAGFSSLTVLADLPIHGIKCDHAFVKDIAEDPARQVLLRHVCEMGKGLGLAVTIEGLETEAEWKLLQSKGADYFQGYLIARPMAADRVAAWLAAREGVEALAVLAPEACAT